MAGRLGAETWAAVAVSPCLPLSGWHYLRWPSHSKGLSPAGDGLGALCPHPALPPPGGCPSL